MRSFTTKDGTNIFYKDWGSGKPIVFSHGWPLTADAWDAQMLFLGMRGHRVIAHDRRGHGRSGQTWDGNEMDTYADDVATLFNELDLHGAVFIGHSTGGGEVAHYLGRHPVLILHGDADQIVPIDDSARKSAKLLKNGTLKVIPGAPHGMCTTLADQINSELLAFIKD